MADQAAELTRSLLSTLFAPATGLRTPDTDGGQAGIAARLWDGSRWPDDRPSPRATLVLKHPGALRAMFLSGTELRLSEAYLYDDFDVEGDLEYAIASATDIPSRYASLGARLSLARQLLRLPARTTEAREVGGRGAASLRGRKHSVQRDRDAIAYHYDVSNPFYRSSG